MSSSRRSYKDTRRWILDRARMEEDANEISSWLLTASLKHPRSFERLLGSYRLLCEKKNIFNAAEDLGKLYLLYSHDSRVWAEFSKIVQSMQSLEKNDARSVFYRAVFNAMNVEVQPVMYLDYVERCSTRQERSDALMIFLRFKEAYKQKISVHWQSLLDSYIKQCLKECNVGVTSEHIPTLLICSKLLPILLKSRVAEVPENEAMSIFQYAACYFIDYLQKEAPHLNLPLDAEVTENEVSRALQPLRHSYQLMALRYRWSVNYFRVHLTHSVEQSCWTSFSTSVQSPAERHCYALLSFVYWMFISAGICETCSTYASLVLVPPILLDVESMTTPVVWFTLGTLYEVRYSEKLQLIQFLQLHSILKMSHALAVLYDTEEGSKAIDLAVQFVQKDLLKNVLLSGLTFAGKGHAYLPVVSGGVDFDNSDQWTTVELLKAVQIACCHFAQAQFKEAANYLLQCLTSRAMRNCQANQLANFDHRWSAMALSEENVYSYAVRLLICCLANVLLTCCDNDNNDNMYDTLVGHMFVMMQVEWPVWSVFAKELAKRLVKRKKFHYPKFQQYIHCPMLIEIICNCVLKCEDVDFLLFEKRGAKRRKQDKKAQLYKQLQSSNVDISTVVKDFFSNENEFLFSCFK
ncbi:Integrator complex subunit 10 [Trichinella pseudospiralis]|uniref:Integrator complex subunit 10 n=2 Tax=Trichinella pseudospiralis TaxID=6337 RepID=A0A0V1IFS0_TRIPS|nr:Integrator complex subunit 10 [Trichinella pseudospiralis]